MNKFIGTYRVCCEKDLITNKPVENGENTYIKCKKNCEIYRYSSEVLVLYIPTSKRGKMYLNLLKPYVFKYDNGDMEYRLYFKESDLDKVVEVAKPSTQGKNIKPKNKRSYKSINDRKRGENNAE